MTETLHYPDSGYDRPNLSSPLLHEPEQASPPVPIDKLGPLKHFIGTWTNENLGDSCHGGPEHPYSYNVMPLPQIDPSSQYGYILKNFSYYEELTFSPIHGDAPNRDGNGTGIGHTLMYEQRVYFADGPAKNKLIHVENGTLLFLTATTQLLGPYGNGDEWGQGEKEVRYSIPPTLPFDILKQVSVPHGNSILALGSYTGIQPGVPEIPPVTTLPSGINTQQYFTENPVANPNPRYTLNPNEALTDALKVAPPTKFIRFDVSTQNGNGGIQNAKQDLVSQYSFTYWLESFDDEDCEALDFKQLQYSQSIILKLPLAGQLFSFPHVTVNTLRKKLL